MKPAGAACASCPGRDRKCVPAEPAHEHTRLAIVGEAPGFNELQQGRPFIGKSGRMLERGLRFLGLRRSEVHWTNAILCDVRPNDMAKAAKHCRARLQRELREAAAPVVMPVGAWGLQGAMNLSKKPQILKWRGSVNQHTYGAPNGASDTTPTTSLRPERAAGMSSGREILGIVGERAAGSEGSAGGPLVSFVCPTVHPAFVMRSAAWAPIFEGDVERVGRVLESGFTAPENQRGRRLIIARTRETLREALGLLQPGADVSFDVETVGLGPTETSLVCFGISDGPVTLVVPWSLENNGIEPWWGCGSNDVAAEVSEALASRVVVTHNGPAFDHIVAARYRIRIVRWEDTLLAQHAVAGHMKKNLHHVVTTAGECSLDVEAWKEREDRSASLDRLWVYNGRDCLYTILAWQLMKREVRKAA
jgi:uracil-DNA glycosylase family 4